MATVRVLGRPRKYPSFVAPAALKVHHPQAIRLLLAWIDACASERIHIYLDAVEAELARELAKLSPVDRWLPAATPEEIRRQLAQRGVSGALLGDWDETGLFHPGLAGLNEQEARATELFAEGFNERQIAMSMDRKRAHMFKDSLSVETVCRYLDRGNAKLRAFFELTSVA